MNPDLVQENSDNQTNHLALEIEEDSNRQLGNASGNQPSSERQDVNPIEAQEDAGNQLNSLDNTLYYKATKGDFRAFKQIDADSLTQLVTRVDKNTILHICITAATPYYRKKTARTKNNDSVDFVKKALARCRALLWQRNKKGETILHIAARHGHHDIVRALLTEDEEARHNGQAVNRPQPLLEMKNEVGDTALHEAVRYSHLRVVEILISEDSNYQYDQNNDGETPLYIAAEKGACNVVREILDACESPAYQGPDKRTALHAAVLSNDEEMVKLLVTKLKELTRKADKLGWTPLHYAAHHGYLPVVKVLLEGDKDAAYIADEEEKTALHVAASEGKANVVKELMLFCPDCFEQVDKNGRNVLHFAVEAKKLSDKKKMLRLVLQNECFSNLINAKDKYGNTPLHHAAATQCSASILVHHPKLNAQVFNNKNLSPLDIILAQSDLPLDLLWTSLVLMFVDNRRNLRIPDKDNGKEREGIKDQDGKNKDELDQGKTTPNSVKRGVRFLRESNIVVATLIAAVTFAAGFTIPGGYISSDNTGPNQGSAVLIRNPALKAFVFSNTIALTLSSTVVFICAFRILYRRRGEEPKSAIYKVGSPVDAVISTLCTIFALIAMVIAFLSGTCAVLAPNPSLVAALCILSTLLFVSSFYLRSFWFLLILWNSRSIAKIVERRRLRLGN